ncbi:MAG: 30S ribosomal protein S16, partial [Gammaproteobacteria bacterium]|nr:30S ribosomal protein S16 [Gammaproteobacteria bacterium]
SKKRPFYKIVVTESRSARHGRFIEKVGYFNPMARGQEVRLEVKNERVAHWLDKGAQTSVRVNTLLKESSKAA